MNQGLEELHATGATLHTTRLHSLLAEGYLFFDRAAEAQDHLSKANQYLQRYHENYVAAELARLDAICTIRCGGSTEDARAGLNRAQEIARSQGAKLFELRALCDSLREELVDPTKRETQKLNLRELHDQLKEFGQSPDLSEAEILLTNDEQTSVNISPS